MPTPVTVVVHVPCRTTMTEDFHTHRYFCPRCGQWASREFVIDNVSDLENPPLFKLEVVYRD